MYYCSADVVPGVGNSKNVGVGHYFMSKLCVKNANGAHFFAADTASVHP